MLKRIARQVTSFLNAFSATKDQPVTDSRRQVAKNIRDAMGPEDWSGPGSNRVDKLVGEEIRRGHQQGQS
ncbi:hypothetical protein [Candidatus Poriferisodalis sp.]|uniref:hypothetical protein n=1 Tax=Candidatus Poriferisodalis sp. TaxID=3101277 RepID=UPI003B025249